MASTADRGLSVDHYALEDLYQQLREIELSDQRLTRQLKDVGSYRRILSYRDSEDDTYMGPGLSRDFLDAQHTTLSACQTLHDKFREVLRKDINIRSRSSVRPLTILDMPDEILVQISEHVKGWTPDPRYGTSNYSQGVSEIKNLRLTCWRFCNVSSHLLLPLVRVELNSASVARLDTISKHPTISKGVQAVRVVLDYYEYELANDITLFAEFSASNLRDQTDLTECMVEDEADDSVGSDLEIIRKARELENSWMTFAGATVGDATLTSNLSGIHLLRQAHEEYRSRTADQTRVYENGAFVRSIAIAIGRMPLATRLEFREFDRRSDRWKRTGSFREGDDDYYLWQMLRPMRWALGRQWALRTPHADVLVDLPIAVYEAGTILKGLDLDISTVPNPHESFSTAQARKISMAVQQVKDININMRCQYLADSDSAHDPAYFEYCHRYIDALSSTDSIEHISLSLECFNGQDMPLLTDLGSLMTFRLWDNLVDVAWQSIRLYQTDLERLLQLRQKPLQSLYLSHVRLLSGSWAETLEILRAAPTGYSVHLSGPLGAECDDLSVEEKAKAFEKPHNQHWSRSRAEEYIIGFSDENPLKNAEAEQTDPS